MNPTSKTTTRYVLGLGLLALLATTFPSAAAYAPPQCDASLHLDPAQLSVTVTVSTQAPFVEAETTGVSGGVGRCTLLPTVY